MSHIKPIGWIFCLVLLIACEPEGSLQTEVVFQVQHHERPIGNAEIQVYLHHQAAPIAAKLDDHDATIDTDSEGRGALQDIPLGNHWFVATGYDEQIAEQVVGHMPLRFDGSMPKHDTTLFVGEEDYYRID